MHNIETALIFVGIPVLVFALVALAVYAGASRRGRRYRPGRPFEFTPVWFLAAPERQYVGPQRSAGHAAVSGANRLALPKGEAETGAAARKESAPGSTPAGGGGDWPATDETERAVTGGASDRW